MKFLQTAIAAAAVSLLVSSAVVTDPVSAQRGLGCTQNAEGGQRGGGGATGGAQDSRQVLVGVVNAAIGNVQTPVTVNALTGATNLQVVCLNDVLNGNDVNILNDLIDGGILNNNTVTLTNVLTNFLNNIDVDILNNIKIEDVRVVAIDLQTGDIFVLSNW